jgi:hypothetical protein
MVRPDTVAKIDVAPVFALIAADHAVTISKLPRLHDIVIALILPARRTHRLVDGRSNRLLPMEKTEKKECCK